MILTVHNLAKEYAVLPSEALVRSNTFDLYVLDVATRWQIYQQKQAEKGNKMPNMPHNLTQEEMQAMLNRVKSRSDHADIQKRV